MIRERQPRVPVSEERRADLLALRGVIILARIPGENTYTGYVEHSWSMGWDKAHVNFWWIGDAETIIGKVEVYGNGDAEEHVREAKKNHLDYAIEVWDAHDPDLPVKLDWDNWVEAQAYDPNTLSGVSNKFVARNIRFEMREA